MKEQESNVNRRNFLGAAAATSAILMACGSGGSGKKAEWYAQPETAPDGKMLKAGLIGCGGRGTGAAIQWLSAGPNVTITALADSFQDRVDNCKARIKEEKEVDVPEENCFVGIDAYQKVIESDVDVILIATPPYFRPIHFKAAVDAKKHVFMEKPVAVDPVGARSIMASAERAKQAGLSVVTGTQRRHQKKYIETWKQVMGGAIGDIVGGNVYWNGQQLWYRTRQNGWSDVEWAIRDWVNWTWLSGDHIVEQHVHNLDVAAWFTGAHPTKALGFGARQRRVTGDQFDMFSIDLTYEDGFHIHSMCRQINGTSTGVHEYLMGTKGSTNCADKIWDAKQQNLIWEHNSENDPNPYEQEHVDLVNAIRTNNPINEAKNTAESTLTAIMGRMSSYTGKEVSWDEAMNSDLQIGPKDPDSLKLGPYNMAQVIPVPGTLDKSK